jgi:hypothetical protein
VAYGSAAVLAAGIGYELWLIPVQVSDSVANIARAMITPWTTLLSQEVVSTAYFRPLLHLQTKLVLAVSRGWEFEAFRLLHIAQVAAAFWLFVRALRVRTPAECAGALVALAAFCGSHTFAGLLNEAYPINNWLTVALCALIALNVVTEERSRRSTDLLVIAALVLAAGTIESGLLVWVAVAAGLLAGCRGVSRPAAAVMTGLVAAYLVTRFAVLDVGAPGLDERSSGFLFERLDERQLESQFGDRRLLFYGYNIASSIATVLLSEPRGGVVTIGQALFADDLRPWMVVNVVSAGSATLLLAWFAMTTAWRRPVAAWTPGQRVLVIAAAVLCANAAISFPYTKDQIMNVGGTFIAAALAAPVALLVSRQRGRLSPLARGLAAALLLTIASTWSVRVIGRQHALAHIAFVTRNDWAMGDPLQELGRAERVPDVVALVSALRSRAIGRVPGYPHVFSSAAAEAWFDHTTR